MPEDGTEAVSAVVSTLLAMAMTVIIGGGVYIVVAGFEAPGPSNVAGLARDDIRDQVIFAKVPDGAFWSDFRLQMTSPGDFEFGRQPTDGVLAVPTLDEVPIGGTSGGPMDSRVAAGTGLYLCVDGGPFKGVTVTITHVQPKTMIWKTTFLELPGC